MDDEKARELIRKKKWKKLQKFDQLKNEQQQGGVFHGWKEGDIDFAPTYKYSVELDNSYTGDKHNSSIPNTGEKRRTPAWYIHHSNFLLIECLVLIYRDDIYILMKL